MSRHALVIYNPAAGTASDADLWLGTVVHRLGASYTVTVLPTVQQMKPEEIFETIGKPLDLVVAAGGDGTLRFALAAVAARKSDIPVGIIPLGTGNQLARNLAIYEENLLTDPLDEALQVIMNGKSMRIDLGQMNGEYFCVAAGVGPMSDAILIPDHHDKNNWKMLAYASSMIQNFALPPVTFQITLEDETFQVAASGVFITNIADLGLGTLSETALINDGLLDLCILNPADFAEYMELGFRFAGGFIGGEAPYYIKKVSSLKLEVVPVRTKLSNLQAMGHRLRNFIKGKSENRPPFVSQVRAMIDGDEFGTTPLEISVIPSAVNVMVPTRIAELQSHSRPPERVKAIDISAKVADTATVADISADATKISEIPDPPNTAEAG